MVKKVGKFYVRKRGCPGGEQHHLHKLTWESVDRMREMRRTQGIPYAKLGEQFGVTTETARDVCLNMTWVRPGEVKVPYRKPNGNNKGERHPLAKMTVEKVREARRRFAAGEYKSVRSLAFEFGITRMTMVHILDGNTWKDVV